MNNNNNIPKIRFKGFTNNWEYSKFMDLAKTRRGLTYNPSNISKKGIRVLRSSNISDNKFVFGEDDVFVDEKAINIEYVKNNDILITSANGSSKLVGKHTLITGISDNSAVHGGFMLLATAKNPKFLNASMNSNWYSKFINVYVLGGNGAIGNLNKTDLDEQNILIPKMNEQNKIGDLFNELDNLIIEQQSKITKLNNIKKSVTEKIFPKSEEQFPEWRFKGFTDIWQCHKATELCSITTGKSNTQDQTEDGKYPFYIRSDIPVKSNKYLYDEEAVITIGDGNIGRVFHYVNGKFDLHQRCYKMADFNEIEAKYFYYFFSTKFYKRAMSMTAKATVDSVRLEMISDMDILYPDDILEQEKIHTLLTNLDKLITLHQTKVNKLNNIKTSLLEKMFV